MAITDSGRVPVTNELIEQVMAVAERQEELPPEEPVITPPPDTVFDLPGGYISVAGEVSMEAEVRELTGRDEEVISKATTPQKALNTVLARGLIRLGDRGVLDDTTLNSLLAGDRDYILLRIYAATFGNEVQTVRFCESCKTESEVTLDLLSDVPVKTLADPFARRFTVECAVGEVTVDLPTGYTQKEIAANGDKTIAELSTILLESTVVQVNGRPVIGKSTVLDLSIRDRRKISDALVERTTGPQFQDAKAECPSCGAELEVPLSLAALFQF
jgi:hypothetical protein